MSEKWERWYKKEYAILKMHYSTMPRKELMQLLPGRTWRAIGHIANEKLRLNRSHDIPKSEEEKAALHTKMSIGRGKRIVQPFAGKHHTAETRVAISVSGLYIRGHSIKDIANRKDISEKEVVKIIKK